MSTQELGFPQPEINHHPSLYLGKIYLSAEELSVFNCQTEREIYLFSARVSMGKSHPIYGEMFRLEFMLVEKKIESGELIYHHLAQFDSVPYSYQGKLYKYGMADMLKKSEIPYLTLPPKWKKGEGIVPIYNEKQFFHFCRQIYIPKNENTKQFGLSQEMIYLFIHINEHDELIAQIDVQDYGIQTIEEHYLLEQRMATKPKKKSKGNSK